ncbi:hypothetical protein Btru_017382 [Bulinus truncatus]|nr:hypothetical protein Btru_017382 [Bulinus truncatus]
MANKHILLQNYEHDYADDNDCAFQLLTNSNNRLHHIIDTVKEIFQVDISINKSAHKKQSDIICVSEDVLIDTGSSVIENSFNTNDDRLVFSNSLSNTSFTIHLKADSASENIKKAKNFLETHIEQGADYSSFPFQLDNLAEFQMVYAASNEIQKSTLVYMEFKPDFFEVTLHGSEKSVCSARNRIVMLLDNYRTLPERCADNDSIKSPFSKDLLLFDHVSGFSNQNSLSATDNSSNHSELVDECLLPKLSSLIMSQPTEEESGMADISICPSYNKLYEQAFKLGYTDNQISRALDKLGSNCGWNDLLGAIISIASADAGKSADKEGECVEKKHLPSDSSLGNQILSGSQNDLSDFLPPSSHWNTGNEDESSNFRHIIIDGSNVAMSHGKQVFSCKGIQLAVDWFRERGHKEITAFVPQWRKETSRPDAPITDQDILLQLEREKILVFTPSRRVKGRRVVCYDDRYILNLAKETDGIIVSNDMYRDLVNESEEFRKIVDQRLLMYSFVNDRFMPPEDPLGRFGPPLENFLCKTPLAKSKDNCPYGKKCTYGNKCRYYHPERGFAPLKFISDTLKEQAEMKLQERTLKQSEKLEKTKQPKQKLSRTKSLLPAETHMVEDFSPRQEKPKLAHSKSVMLPVKTADYLNEPRRMLEQAEFIAARDRMVDIDKSSRRPTGIAQLEEDPISYKSDGLLKPSNSRTSPVPHKEGVKNPANSSSNSPLRTLKSAHLTVPKSDQPERYLSGHLLLAKKLSDEGNESNFFSDHTSSPASTRTTSPVLAAFKPEQKQVNKLERSYPVVQKQRPDENIPNLSIFDTVSSQRHHSINENWENNNSPFTAPPLVPQYSDSGQFTASESLSNPLQFPVQYPLNAGVKTQEHVSLRRSFSTSQPLSRPSTSGNHLLLKPQQSIPLDQFSPSAGIYRQNSSSDPHIQNYFNSRQQVDNQPAQQSYIPPLIQSIDSIPQYTFQHLQQPYQTFDTKQTPKRTSSAYGQDPFSNQQMGFTFNFQNQYDPQHSPVYQSGPPVRNHSPHYYNYSPSYSPFMPGQQPHGNNMSYSPQHAMNPMTIPPEDEPIIPDDPRYSIYYHLSSVFGEPLVRKVMNRNPHVLKPDEVCSLILEFKQENIN